MKKFELLISLSIVITLLLSTPRALGLTTILFSENFDSYPNGSQPTGWAHDNDFSVQNGAYQRYSTVNGGWSIAFYTGQKFTDFNYTVTATGLPNCVQTPPVLGIAFRVQDRGNLYYAWIDIDKAQLKKTINGHDVSIGVGHKTGFGGQFNPLGTYKLTVVANGPNIYFFINGILQLVANDATYSQGFIGVNTYNCNASWDNVVVTNNAAYKPSLSVLSASGGQSGGKATIQSNLATTSSTMQTHFEVLNSAGALVTSSTVSGVWNPGQTITQSITWSALVTGSYTLKVYVLNPNALDVVGGSIVSNVFLQPFTV